MNKKQVLESEELLPEYDFDYTKAKPNRFAERIQRNTIVLDEDVARFFGTAASVNRVLRAIIQTMPLHDEESSAKKAG